jgi:hypothetical protein
MRLRSLALAAVALCAVALPSAAAAKTLEVRTQAESGAGSLGDTILEAGPGDTIELPPGEYLLINGDTLVEQQNVLRGAGEGRTTVVPTGGGEALEQISYSGLTVAEPLQAEEDDDQLETRVQIVALIATLALFILVLDLVRRRRLAERYALLWMSVAVALLVLAIWRGALDVIADAMGIADPANAIFILAIGAAFVLLLHFSVATSRLSGETKILAQETARLDHELRAARGELARVDGAGDGEAASALDSSEGERSAGDLPRTSD